MTANAKNLSTLANVLDDATNGQFLQSTGSGGIVFADVAAGASVYDSAELLPLSGNDAGDMAYVNSTNRFYINNGSGWYSISLVNTNPNITSVQDAAAGTTPFTLTTDGTATVITITANDPEDIPLTYGYSVTSGSLTNGGGTTATVAQSDNVFTVTPTTTEAYAGTFSLTFTASDGINTATSDNSFTLNFITTITNSNYTTLLATATSNKPYSAPSASNQVSSISIGGQTSSPTEVVFGDSGTKMFVLSSNRYVYSYSVSTAYDASTASYVATSSELTELSTDTSQSFRFKPDGTVMFVSSSGGYVYQYSLSTAWDVSTISYASKSATHANSSHSYTALTFKPDGTRMYMAGLRYVMSMTLSTPWDLGAATSDNSSTGFTNAYLNLGWVYGHTITGMDFNSTGTSLTMVYGNNASDKYIIEHPIDSAWNVSNATVLGAAPSIKYQQNTIQGLAYANNGNTLISVLDTGDTVYTYDTSFNGVNNNITDTSSNNHSITVNGDAHAGTFSPYRHGGYSTYFDGSGDWLELTGTALGNGNFTVEAWVWLDSLKDYNVIYDDRATGSSATGLALGVTSTGAPYLYTNNGFQITSSQTCTAKKWHHISLVRSSGVITIYLDGTSGGTYSSSANFTDTNLGIGVARTYTVTSQFGGYIRDVRAVVGTAITPASGGPTERLEAVTNTSLLTCHLPYIADGSTNDHSITVNGNTSTKPFSPYDYSEYSATDHGGSVYFDGTGDVIYTSQDTAFNFGTADFTFEAWVYPTLYTSDWNTLFAIGNSTNFGGLLVGKSDDGYFVIRQYGTANIVSTTTLPDLNVWTHIACVRSGGTSKLYYNGSEIATASDTTNYSSTTPFAHIGNSDHTTYSHYWNGYVSDARFISGTAVYTGNFTPPTAPLSSSGAELHIKGTDASIIDKSQGANLELVNTTGSTTQVKFADTKSIYTGGNSSATIRLDASNKFYDLSYGEGDFTVEGWFYTTDNTNNPKLYIDISSASAYWQLYYISGSGITLRANNTGIYSIETGNSFTENTWHHIALCRSGSNYKVFHNGTEIINVNSTHQIGSNSTKTIGGTDISTGNNLRGYIQDFRITKGLARYTATFTPPTASLEG